MLSILPLWGQGGTFPVQVIPQATPPPPIYFSDYANAATVNSPLRVQIILNDFEIANREIRLKTYFQGNGISFQSNDIVVGASPLFLEGGIPLVLTNTELAPYFQFENITGISPNAYGRAIPEGAYEFCFEVYDVLTGSRLSNRSCAMSVVFQNDPPFLIVPRNKEEIKEINPQNIVFQWTPRSINVTNVEYELSIVEIWDTQVDPQQAFLSSPPVFQTTTTTTTYVYGPSDPLLLSGKNYAWRVQAKAKQGTEDIGLFDNQGYSEIFSFSYSESCDLPLSVTHEVKGSVAANIKWEDFSTDVPEYTVRYRQKGNDNEWFPAKTTLNEITLWDLKAGTTYEYQLQKKCVITQSEWSIARTFTTALDVVEEDLFECGIAPNINLENMEPLAGISKGETFIAGDFPVTILEVSGSNGRFTGKGYVKLPYLENIKSAVEFTNILINTDRALAEGMVSTVYDPTWKNILDVDVVIDVADDILDEFTGGDQNVPISVDFEIPSKDNIKIEDGKIVITGPNGQTTTEDYDEGDSYVITDSKGNTYNIDKDGKITEGGKGAPGGEATAQNTSGISGGSGNAANPSVTEITATDITITFDASSSKYGFDQATSAFEKANYHKVSLPNGGTYYPPHKAVIAGQSDQLVINVQNSNSEIKLDSLIFKTVKGVEIPSSRTNNSFTLTLNGTNSYHSDEAIVTYKAKDGKYKIASSFFIHHIKEHEKVDVVVVQVNTGSALATLNTDLDKIFKTAGASFNVTNQSLSITDAQWDTKTKNNSLDYDGSGLASNYPDEFKNITQAYKDANPNWNRRAYHLFVLPDNMPNTKGINGFMPKGRQWGYVFEAHVGSGVENKSSLDLTAMHELGHGVFGLPHPFENDEDTSGKGTDWLMDYGGGDQLSYPNWAHMSDDGLKLYLFQSDQEGELSTNPNKEAQIKKVLNHIQVVYSGKANVLDWSELVKNKCSSYREGRPTNCSLVGKHSIKDDSGNTLKFRLTGQPSASDKFVSITASGDELKIKKRKILFVGKIYDIFYELTLQDNSDGSKFTFEFGHHDEIEAFCKYLGIKGKYTSPNAIVELQEDLSQVEAEKIYDKPSNMTWEQYFSTNSIVLDEVVINAITQSNISKSIIDFLDEKYLPENIDDSTECDDIDIYFAEIPSFHTTNNLVSTELWTALKSLLKCSVNDRYTDEEKAVLTIIESLGKKGADDFFSGLIANKVGNNNILKLLFLRMDDWGGDDNFTNLVNNIYSTWKQSSYKSLGAEPIPYESSKLLGFYSSNYSLNFNTPYTRLELLQIDGAEAIAGSTDQISYSYEKISDFDPFSPIQLRKYKEIDSELKLPAATIPIFLLKALSIKNETANWETAGALTFDVATTLTGVGNLAKLRHLRHLRKLGKLKSLKIVIGGVEVISGASSAMLNYTDTCNSQDTRELCQKLQIYLTILEVASLSADAAISKALQKSADDALAAINRSDEVIPDEIVDELTAISRANVNSIDELVELVDEKYRASLRLDLESSEELVEAFTKNPELIESWKRFGDSPLRANTKFLDYINDFPVSWKVTHNGGITKILDGNSKELAELSEGLIKTKGGTKANGNWNKLLNKPPMKNQKYQIDDYLFETDELGRVKNVKGELQNIERGRLNSQQTSSVALKDGVAGDEGGHLIANILNGPGEQLNYLPQTKTLNNGAWKEMETLWKNALNRQPNAAKVEVDIRPIFEGTSKRPVAFEVDYWIDEVKKSEFFDN